ncbi:MAG: holo-ACP synthase [Burkholderiaceae bacterium]|nr:MAG: holo-ACP synthase [Burkholderiaceae bacterium]
MIVGVGTDLVEIARVAAALERHEEAFAERILGAKEMQEFHRRSASNEKNGIAYLAKRFAAKEAFAKAFGSGISGMVVWHNIEVLNDAQGCPQFQFHGELLSEMMQRSWQAHVSLTDEKKYAQAFVILEKP